MNAAHLHLMVNHVSLFAVGFGLLALLWFFFRNSKEMLIAAVFLFALGGASGWITVETGEEAEDIVEQSTGESQVVKGLIHEHEEAAEKVNILCTVLAIAGFGLFWGVHTKAGWAKPLKYVVLVLALAAVAGLARTANLGGLISHPEIRSAE